MGYSFTDQPVDLQAARHQRDKATTLRTLSNALTAAEYAVVDLSAAVRVVALGEDASLGGHVIRARERLQGALDMLEGRRHGAG